MRTHVCKNPSCKATYTPQKIGQKVCSIPCAIEYSKIDREAKRHHAERKATRDKRQALKSRRQWLNEAQQAFNAYIRERDAALPCISCGRHHQGQYHAGHFYSVGARANLRFTEDNVHKQCQPCNTEKSGNALEYRVRLIQRIGQARVEALENDTSVVKWTIEDAKRIKTEYRTKLNQLRKERSHGVT